MKKGQILHNIKVTTIGFWWVGIGVAPDGKKILIKWSVLPHSTIDCVVIKSKKDHILAMPTKVTDIESERADQTPLCPHYSNPLVTVPDDMIHKNWCGWCKRQLLSYPKQLELKTHLVHDSFRGVKYLLESTPLEPIIPSPLTYHYRNKIEFSFGKYITKAKNDRKAEVRRNWPSPSSEAKGLVDQKNNWIIDWLDALLYSAWQNPDFSHYHNWQLGFHKQGFYTHVIDIDQCYLISEYLHRHYLIIKKICENSGLPVYDPMRNSGFFRHLVLREWYNTQQILVNLVISDEQLTTAEMKMIWEQCKQSFLTNDDLRQSITTFLITYNNTLSDAVKRQDTHSSILRWEGYIFEELHFQQKTTTDYSEDNEKIFTIEDGIAKESSIKKQENHATMPLWNSTTSVRFRISPFSFFQTNTRGAQVLFQQAATFIKLPHHKQAIMDLYCGAGTIGLSLLAQGIGNFVLGIEIVEDAIKDAHYNAKINQLDTKSYFVAGKTENILKHDPKFSEKIDEIWLIIVDPPREWLHKDVCEFLNNLKQNHTFQLIYISCNPVTLARDLDLLVQGGRSLQHLQPVDMFPHTHHVEIISVLS